VHSTFHNFVRFLVASACKLLSATILVEKTPTKDRPPQELSLRFGFPWHLHTPIEKLQLGVVHAARLRNFIDKSRTVKYARSGSPFYPLFIVHHRCIDHGSKSLQHCSQQMGFDSCARINSMVYVSLSIFANP
jgi:hypothetical protein